jgi:hypothetical protein
MRQGNPYGTKICEREAHFSAIPSFKHVGFIDRFAALSGACLN